MSKSKVISAPFVRNPYNYDTAAASDETALVCDDPSLAQQNFKESSDINNIVASMLRGNDVVISDMKPLLPDYYDALTYHEALNRISQTQSIFMQLPADVRSRFQNDPGNLISFMDDPANLDEARSLGLVNPVQAPVGPSPSVEPASKPKRTKASILAALRDKPDDHEVTDI